MKRLSLFVLPAVIAASSTPAFAQANYSAITSAVDFDAVITALMAVAAVVAGVLIARKGIRFLLGALK